MLKKLLSIIVIVLLLLVFIFSLELLTLFLALVYFILKNIQIIYKAIPESYDSSSELVSF